MSRKKWIQAVFEGKGDGRVPVGFWHHFTSEEDWTEGLRKPAVVAANRAGHHRFVREVKPDFVKLMSDGFFDYPHPALSKPVVSIQDLEDFQSIGREHPWFTEQVRLVEAIRADFPEDLFALYNIFAPATYLKWKLAHQVASGDMLLADFIKEDAGATARVLEVIGQDIQYLVEWLLAETGIDGIYLSVQTVQDVRVSPDEYRQVIAPSEEGVLAAANAAGGLNILHICGYEGASNDIGLFVDYPAHVVNWATGIEDLSLAQGQAVFADKVVLGGFDNTKEGLFYRGRKEEIEARVREIVAETDPKRLIIGADCTIPSDSNLERIDWVRQALGTVQS